MPTCKELTELVTEYLEGRLAPAEKGRFESHVSKCQVCEYYIKQMRSTVDALGQVPKESMPDAARASFQKAFQDWKKKAK